MNMDTKFYVFFETAKMLKEKGFNEMTDCSIDEDGKFWNEQRKNETMPEWKCSAPTKAEAIDWLESKGIVLETLYAYMEGIYFYTVYYNNEEIDVPSSRRYKTRLEAEDAAIIKALELLK